MGYTNVEGWAQYFREADAWALITAGIGVLLAIWMRSRFGIALTILGIASAIATAVDPQGSLYNVRLLPLWFISVYLMAAWTFGMICIAVAETWRRSRARGTSPPDIAMATPTAASGAGGESIVDGHEQDWVAVAPNPASYAEPRTHEPTPTYPLPTDAPPDDVQRNEAEPRRRRRALPPGPWAPGAVGGALAGLLVVLAIVIAPLVSWIPASLLPVTPGPNEVANWSHYNYVGYQGQSSWPEYNAIMRTMDSVSKRYGCGREMWEYSPSENRFGTPEALMLLPYWTNGCIDSMEGLLFESSTTTPYHFINQAELSAEPSDPEVGLPYGSVDVSLGVQHLQLLGVKYFMAETSEVEAEANADPNLKLVAKTGRGRTTTTGRSARRRGTSMW